MKFQFRFETLLELRRRQRDEAGAEVGQAREAIRRIDQQREELNQQRVGLRQKPNDERTGTISVDRLLSAGRYDMQLEADDQALLQTRGELMKELARRQRKFSDAESELKRFEKLKEHDRKLMQPSCESSSRPSPTKRSAEASRWRSNVGNYHEHAVSRFRRILRGDGADANDPGRIFVSRGTISGDTLTQVVALLNGIDISGNRLRQIMRQSEDREQPDFDEILEARMMESLDMDMRLRSQKEFRDDLGKMLAEHTEEKDRFDQRLNAFDKRLKELQEGAKDKGLREVQKTIQLLEPEQAKNQLLIIYDDERIDEVVNIVQAMAADKRKDILAEFQTAEEEAKLAEILRRVSEGLTTTALINEAAGSR